MTPLVLISALVASYMCYVEGQSCITPSRGNGDCVSLYDCEPLMAIVNKPNKSQQDINLLRKSQCGYDGDVPKVCCPATDSSCYTPDGQLGKCVGIYSCPQLAERLAPPVPQETINFIQNSRCEGPDQYSVCCGAQAPPQPQPTTTENPIKNGVCSSIATLADPKSRCCGVESGNSDKITGGTATAVDQYPWLALIEYFKDNRIKLLCGATLISGKYVLTAGHCVKGSVLNYGTPKNVRLGEYDTASDNGPDCVETQGGGQDCTEGITVIPIETIVAHPEYNPSATLRRHDIALIRLRRLAPYTDFIRPICLPVVDVTANPPPKFALFVAGWGRINDTVGHSDLKLHVGMPYVNMQKCQPEYTKPGRNVPLWQGQVCAGGETGKDSCKGDSGGPLMYEKNFIFELIGVVSFGPTPCGLENVPGVYTKVFEYLPWIKSQIQP